MSISTFFSIHIRQKSALLISLLIFISFISAIVPTRALTYEYGFEEGDVYIWRWDINGNPINYEQYECISILNEGEPTLVCYFSLDNYTVATESIETTSNTTCPWVVPIFMVETEGTFDNDTEITSDTIQIAGLTTECWYESGEVLGVTIERWYAKDSGIEVKGVYSEGSIVKTHELVSWTEVTDLETFAKTNAAEFETDGCVLVENNNGFTYGGNSMDLQEFINNGAITGSGTEFDPYVLKCVKFISCSVSISSTTNYLEIRNCMIQGDEGYSAVQISNAENILIENLTINGNYENGIVFYQSRNCKVINSSISNTRFSGIILSAGYGGDTQSDHSESIEISNNTIYNVIESGDLEHYGSGIVIQSGIDILISNNKISKCATYGIYIDYAPTEHFSNVVIQDNDLCDNYGAGIGTTDLDEGEGSATFENNECDGLSPDLEVPGFEEFLPITIGLFIILIMDAKRKKFYTP